MKRAVLISIVCGLAGVLLLGAPRLLPSRAPQAATSLPAVPAPTYNGPRNQFLNGTIFEDVTAGSGFDHQGHGKCIAMGDFDKDGDLDIYISVVYGKNKLFQNEGNLHFKEMGGPLPSTALTTPTASPWPTSTTTAFSIFSARTTSKPSA